MYIKIITFSILGLMISGCSYLSAVDEKNESLKQRDPIKLDSVLFVEPKLSINKYEEELVRLAGKVEKQRKRYYSLLENRKELKNQDIKNHIPAGMGARISIDFQGYLGNLFKIIARKSNYELKFENLTIKDTPIINRKYDRTMLFDILEEISDKYNIDVKIIENDRIIEISIKG